LLCDLAIYNENGELAVVVEGLGGIASKTFNRFASSPAGARISPMNKIAIIGMACLFPGAPDLASYWSNIVRGFDATREVTDKEWSLADYYDKDATKFGLSYAKRGGFITEFAPVRPP
jgi:hypothetical protein